MTWQVTFADSATPIQGVKSSKGKLLEECSKLYYEYFFNDEPKHIIKVESFEMFSCKLFLPSKMLTL